MKEKNYLFEFIRLLFTVSVIISHASATIYKGEIVSGNVAVDGFFMLSGLFMAKQLHDRQGGAEEKIFVNYHLHRIKRLFPMYFLSCMTGIFFSAIFFHKIPLKNWPALYFLGDINGIPGFWVTWYVAALFWAGIFVSAFLIWKEKLSVLVIFPLLFFITFSYMYSYHNLWLYAQPLIKGFFSVGIVKAVCALIVGTEVFYLSQWLKNKKERVKSKVRKIFAFLCEIIFIYGFASSFWIWFSPRNFFVYLYVPLIMLVILLEEEFIFRIFNRKIFAFLGKLTYSVYLTHLYFIKFLEKTGFCEKIFPVITYIVLVPAAFFIGWIFCKIEKFCVMILNELLIKKEIP